MSMFRMLVVDDEPYIVDSVTAILSEMDEFELDIYPAYSAVEALELVKQRTFDIVLSDILMPGMDGRALTRALRTDPHYRSIPIVLMSAGRAPDQGIDGYDAYISKPFNLYMVLDTVTELLGRGGSSPAR